MGGGPLSVKNSWSSVLGGSGGEMVKIALSWWQGWGANLDTLAHCVLCSLPILLEVACSVAAGHRRVYGLIPTVSSLWVSQ